jgi:hypothetical protein
MNVILGSEIERFSSAEKFVLVEERGNKNTKKPQEETANPNPPSPFFERHIQGSK